METKNGTGSNEFLRMHPDATTNGHDPIIQDIEPGFSSSSSFSSCSSNPQEFNRNEKDGLDDSCNTSPMVSPQIQRMGHPADYDPNRVPLSIFANKSSTPVEWSVASNESLFSIHMGNSSFSRDQFALSGLGKSGELARIDELDNFSSCLPAVVEEPPSDDVKSVNTEEDDEMLEKANETSNMRLVKNVEDPSKARKPPAEGSFTSESPSRLSDESGHRSSSFVSKILESDLGKAGSMKAVHEKPESQSQTPVANSKAAETNWLSCFSCSSAPLAFLCPRCC